MALRIGYLALIVYALSLLGAAIAPAPRAVAPAEPAPAPVEPPEQLIGFALNFHHTPDLTLYLKAIDEIAAMGFNSVEVLTPAFQANGASEQIGVEVRPGGSPSKEQLVTLLQHAHSRGLKTSLMPIVLLTTPRGNEWRGKIQPEHWQPWWNSYTSLILDHFVDAAIKAEVDVFSVGSELLSTEKDLQRWEQLIAQVRRRFEAAGLDTQLTYSTNWDHYQTPGFWKYVDMIGINGYWDLTTLAKQTPPEREALVARWREIRRQVLAYGAAQRKPILLTEIGYPSLPWGLKDPWNYIGASDVAAAPEVQLAGYQAFLAAWGNDFGQTVAPGRLRGVFFYKWDPYQEGGPRDTGYGVRGKPAHDLLRTWLRRHFGLEEEDRPAPRPSVQEPGAEADAAEEAAEEAQHERPAISPVGR